MIQQKRWIRTLLTSVFLVGAINAFCADQYEIDPVHSTLGFAIKHLQVGTTRGQFDNYVGDIYFDPQDDASFKADVTIQADSIDTRNTKRDDHLRTADFFDVANFPTITFKSQKLERQGDSTVMTGDLTIKAVTKTISIPVTIAGPVEGPGVTVIGINGEITINRQDYNIKFSKMLDNGGLMVGDQVHLVIEIEAHKK
ncbi:MAG: YceI family protein [Candidatus Omnitrophota bacterium]|nr:YceI family protein [Candidatus Omnitrophota bacterium]